MRRSSPWRAATLAFLVLTPLLGGAARAADTPPAAKSTTPAAEATSPGAAPTVAVAYFDDNSGDPAFAPLAKGLADMLITDLSAIESIRIVERARLNEVLAELKLGEGSFIDPATAQRLGKGLAAGYILTGAYTVAGEELRLDARVVKVETGEVAAAEKVAGPKDAFFALEKELVDVLVRTLDLKLGLSEKTKLRSNPTESFAAWLAYASGLDAQDRGDPDEAKKRFREALRRDPGYRAARSALGRLEAIFARDDRARAARIQELTKEIDATAPDFPEKIDALLGTFDDSVVSQVDQKVALLTWLVENDLTPARGPIARTPRELLGLLSRFLQDPDTWPKIPAVCEYVITRYPGDMAATPQCKAYVKAMKKMQEVDEEIMRASWERGQAGATLDYHVAIVRNTEAIQALFDACVRKVEADR